MTDVNDTLDNAPLGAWTGGWKLDERDLRKVGELVATRPCARVLEFGSGGSTHLLELLREVHGFPEEITSFDHDGGFAHPRALIRPLADYHRPLDAQTLAQCSCTPALNPGDTRAPYRFYALAPDDLSGIYDFVLLDGPFGRGRSIAFHAIAGHARPGTLVFIDDWSHYPFEADLLAFFTAREIWRGSNAVVYELE